MAETIRGHVSCSFLALVLKAALEDRIVALGRAGSRPEIIADLDSLTETEIEHEGKNVVPSRWLGAFMVSGRGRVFITEAFHLDGAAINMRSGRRLAREDILSATMNVAGKSTSEPISP